MVRNRPGTFGRAPDGITTSDPCSPTGTWRRTSATWAVPASSSAKPGSRLQPSTVLITPQRRSASISTMRRPREAPIRAKLIAESVFPSPGSGLVNTTTLSGRSR